MTEHQHFVYFEIESGDIVHTKYVCEASEDAPCRTHYEEFSLSSPLFTEKQVISIGNRCNFLDFLETESEYNYDGVPKNLFEVKTQDGRAPIKITWEGEYYVWEFA